MSRNRLAYLAAVSAGALLSATAAFAADAPSADVAEVDKVTVTATRSEKSVLDVPATVTVTTSQEIEDALVNDVKDLVRFEPGVSVRSAPSRFTAAGASTGRDGNAGFAIRGLEGNRVLIMVDGVRVPDGYAFGAQAAGRGDYVDVDVLKSVEIVRGPASALYGSDGLAGSVSFFTKNPSDILQGKSIAARGRVGYSSADESWSESALVAGASGRWEGLLAYTRRDGHETETQGTAALRDVRRTVANPEDNSSNAVLGKLVFNLDDRNKFSLTVDHLDRDIDWNVLSAITYVAPGATPASTAVVGLTAFDKMRRDRVSLAHAFTGGQGLIQSARTTLYYQDSTTRQFSAEDRYTAADRTRDAKFDNEVFGGAVELTSKASFGGVDHSIVWGADASLTRQQGLRDGTVPPAGETFPNRAFPTTDYTLFGGYVQDEFSVGPVTFYPALRYDYYKLDPKNDPLFTANTAAGQSDSRFSPKLSAVWQATDLISVFANAATGFKAPAPSQVNNGFSNPTSFYTAIANPDLKPETSETFELGFRLRQPTWNISVTGFTGKYDDFIEQVQVSGSFRPTDPAVFQFVNLAEAEISGAEARGEVLIGDSWRLIGAASYARGFSTNTAGVSTPLQSVDPAKFTAGLSYRDPAGRFGGQASVMHVQKKSFDSLGVTCTGGCFAPPAFTTADITAYWNVTEAVTLRGGVFNLTDEKYWWWSDVRGQSAAASATVPAVIVDGYTAPGRNYSVSLAVKF
ncbi:TonB-dependent hemoglobin/transferrin/lactoferrin family receptor [Caulobacter endophyticus]|uniref:TonB-dependent hemoglobin/transferrin/lactoferrin family receptor n=1 Tax=Caulobacter endophyticus TaxID=2172652 RepID=UPI00240F1B63|nr:TonB-dependent hemoglobin/transferrin/lactoferrin family receptor [Caulobacter endophyticus]MDG2530626.1 TonB-dependent hemoglobin/transferrin/lactoferrin family receptor [Caulobacter endophyticus]